MTPGWMNVRNRLAESYEPPRGMPSMRARVFWGCTAVSVAMWILLLLVVR